MSGFYRPYEGSFPISQRWGNGAWGANGEGGHPGTDYACPEGTRLIACADFEVIYAGPADGFGDHAICLWFPALGAAATYGHAKAHFVATGDRGAAGTVIGLSGWQGTVSPPGPGGSHLHFEIRYVRQAFAGNPPNVDSEEWLRFFEAMASVPATTVKAVIKAPLKPGDVAKIKAIQKATGVRQTGHWDKDTDKRLQTLRWKYLTPPREVQKDRIVSEFQKAMGLPSASQDRVWGAGTDAAYNLCRLVFLGK